MQIFVKNISGDSKQLYRRTPYIPFANMPQPSHSPSHNQPRSPHSAPLSPSAPTSPSPISASSSPASISHHHPSRSQATTSRVKARSTQPFHSEVVGQRRSAAASKTARMRRSGSSATAVSAQVTSVANIACLNLTTALGSRIASRRRRTGTRRSWRASGRWLSRVSSKITAHVSFCGSNS